MTRIELIAESICKRQGRVEKEDVARTTAILAELISKIAGEFLEVGVSPSLDDLNDAIDERIRNTVAKVDRKAKGILKPRGGNA